ncbi:LCP family protein [Streptomyces sp. NPDC007095]|uniref:LCP family protein n=1 Tax=Streptomyces sp. NPDC007095 TaxID=3154482 RepID=UPI00340EB190
MTTSDQARPPRRRRSPLRIALVVALAVLLLGTAGLGWIHLKLNGNIDTFGADGLSKDRPAVSTKGENVLVIGSDARTDGNSALGGGDKGDIGRSDTAILLHVYADHRHAVAVSIPRDTLVTLPPCKLPDGTWTRTRPNTMFNEAYSVGQTAKGGRVREGSQPQPRRHGDRVRRGPADPGPDGRPALSRSRAGVRAGRGRRRRPGPGLRHHGQHVGPGLTHVHARRPAHFGGA